MQLLGGFCPSNFASIVGAHRRSPGRHACLHPSLPLRNFRPLLRPYLTPATRPIHAVRNTATESFRLIIRGFFTPSQVSSPRAASVPPQPPFSRVVSERRAEGVQSGADCGRSSGHPRCRSRPWGRRSSSMKSGRGRTDSLFTPQFLCTRRVLLSSPSDPCGFLCCFVATEGQRKQCLTRSAGQTLVARASISVSSASVNSIEQRILLEGVGSLLIGSRQTRTFKPVTVPNSLLHSTRFRCSIFLTLCKIRLSALADRL